MKHLWLILYLLPSLSFAEIAIIHDEAKDGGKVEVAHVDAGAVQGTIQPGAVQVPVTGTVQAGAVQTTFSSPLLHNDMPITLDAPMTIKEGAVAFTLYPRCLNFSVEPGAVQVQPGAMQIKVILEVPPEIAKIAQTSQAVSSDVKNVWAWRYWILGVAILVGAMAVALAWQHGRGRGHKATIAALTKTILVMALCLALNGCGWAAAGTLFTASGSLGPKLTEVVAVSTAAATLAKSTVDGVTAVEEFKAMMRGRNPHVVTSNGNITGGK